MELTVISVESRSGDSVTHDDGFELMSRDHEVTLERDVFLLAPRRGEETYLLYLPTSGLVIELSTMQANLLLHNRLAADRLGHLLDSLVGGRVRAPIVIPQGRRTYSPTAVALMMTTACQLRCSYCYAEAGSTPTVHMDSQMAFDAIDFITENADRVGQDGIFVHFHGAGEPTLRWSLIFDTLEYARRKSSATNLALRTVITTNLCIPSEKAVRLATEIDMLIVSCDGTPDVMRANRPMPSGDSAYELEKALRDISTAGLSRKVWIRATVTRATQERLSEFVKYFVSLGVKTIVFVPVSGSGRGSSLESVDPVVFLNSWRLARATADVLGVDLDSPIVDLDRLKPLGFACGIGGSNFALMPDGTVSVCYEAVVPGSRQHKHFAIGKYVRPERRFEIDLDAVNHIRETFHVSRRTVCDSCFCRLTCAGKCAARELGSVDDPRNVPMSVGCDITRELTYDALRNLLHNQGRAHAQRTEVGPDFGEGR